MLTNYYMKIVETRPALTSSWSKFENVPLYEIQKIKHSCSVLDYDLLIFQSPSAVMTFDNLPSKYPFPVIGMGPGTIRELKKKHHEAIAPKKPNSENVIELLENYDFQKALIIRGKEGLNLIESYLDSMDKNYQVCETYARLKLESYSEAIDQFNNVDGIIFSSVFAVEIFFSKISKETKCCKFFAMSERVKKSILNYGQDSIIIDYFSENLYETIESTLT